MNDIISIFVFSTIITTITIIVWLKNQSNRFKRIISGCIIIGLSLYFYTLEYIPSRIPILSDLYDPYKTIACLVMIANAGFLIFYSKKTNNEI